MARLLGGVHSSRLCLCATGCLCACDEAGPHGQALAVLCWVSWIPSISLALCPRPPAGGLHRWIVD